MSEADQMSGVFRKWQGEYAKRGIPTFPVNDNKKPATMAYNKVGLKGSAELAEKFTEANALGLMLGPRSGLTVLDIDTRDELVLVDALRTHGDSHLKVQSAGGFHVYYAHRGEGRFIRPDPEKPIDILGNGFIVAPPSQVAKGEYRIIEGTLDDLLSLPPLHSVLDSLWRGPIPDGVRNNTVFRRLLRQVSHCDDFDSLLDVARTLNMDCIPPMEDASVLNTAKKVWQYETTGNNWVGRKARASTDREEILFLSRDPHAAHLLNLLRVSHPKHDDRFAIDQIKTAELLGWDRGTVAGRIRTLINANRLERVHYGKGKGDPHLYKLKRGPCG